MNNLLGLLSLLLVEWPLSGSVIPPQHGPYLSPSYQRSSRVRSEIQFYPHNYVTQRLPKANPWGRYGVSPRTSNGTYLDKNYLKSISKKADFRTHKTLANAKNTASRLYWKPKLRQSMFSLSNERIKKTSIPHTGRSFKLRPTIKKATLSPESRWARNQVDHKKKKKQYIVANWGGLGLGNGYALGLTGTPTATYSAGLGTGYGTGLTTGLASNYGAGIGTMLATGTNALGSEGVLDTRQNFGTNYGTSNSQGSLGLSDLSAAGLNSLTSQTGLNYLSNLAGGGETSDLNSLNSINQYQNSDLDILDNNRNSNTGLAGLNSFDGTAQSQQYAGNNNLQNSLEGKLTVGGGGRQGIGGSMDLGMDGLNDLGGGNSMSDSSLQQLIGQIMNTGGGGGVGAGGGRMEGGGARVNENSDNMEGDMGNLDLGSLGINLGGMGNKQGNGIGNPMDNEMQDLGGMENNMGNEIGGMGNAMAGMSNGMAGMSNGMGGMGNGMAGMSNGMGGMGNGMAGMSNGMGIGGAGMAMGMGGMGHGMHMGGMHIGGHAAGTMGGQDITNTEADDAQPSDSPDEQPMTGFGMQRPLAIAPIVPGQTVHAHASDKPKRPSYPTSDISPADMALKVQLKANREHQIKLKELKMKLRRLREKLRRLKTEYKYSDDEEETEKSEMETLKDLKKATEQAIRELQVEAAKADKRKGVKKLIFIHNVPDSGKTGGLEDLGTDLLALIESNKPTSGPSANGPTRSRPLNLKPAALTTQIAQKKEPIQDDTNSLTELEKQAEQEVNFMTNNKDKASPNSLKPGLDMKIPAKQNRLNPGLKIKIPEPVEVSPNQSKSSIADIRMHVFETQIAPQRNGHRMSPTPHLSVPLRPKVIKTPGGQRLLNPLQLNNLAQILPAPVDNSRDRKFHPSRPLNGSRRIFHPPGYFSIGCWRDQPERALPSLEGIFPMLDGNDYKARKFPIKKCATIARVQGFPAFALENGGQCLGGKDILQTYNMYGASSACQPDGRGGPWSMEVYKFTKHTPSRRGGIPRLKSVNPPLVRKQKLL